MSFGMAFFSITMLLGIAGFHMSDLRHLDLSSKGITKTYYATQARMLRYYENMRLVYEIESRVRDLRRAATPETSYDNKPQQQQQQQPRSRDQESVEEREPAGAGPQRSEVQPRKRSAWAGRGSGSTEEPAAVRDLTGGAFGRAGAVPFPSQLASARVNGEFIQQARLNRRTA